MFKCLLPTYVCLFLSFPDDLELCVEGLTCATYFSILTDTMQFQMIYKVTHHADIFLRHSLHSVESLSLVPLPSLLGMKSEVLPHF